MEKSFKLMLVHVEVIGGEDGPGKNPKSISK
jgi:hypothetical protein